MAHCLTPDPTIIALGVRQPWVELILRGIKTVEVRSSNTNVRGLIYLYSSKKLSDMDAATTAIAKHEIQVSELPCGLLVGSVELYAAEPATPGDAAAACVPADVLHNKVAWRLRNPVRFDKPHPVRFLPYGVWFYPYQRRNQN